MNTYTGDPYICASCGHYTRSGDTLRCDACNRRVHAVSFDDEDNPKCHVVLQIHGDTTQDYRQMLPRIYKEHLDLIVADQLLLCTACNNKALGVFLRSIPRDLPSISTSLGISSEVPPSTNTTWLT